MVPMPMPMLMIVVMVTDRLSTSSSFDVTSLNGKVVKKKTILVSIDHEISQG